MDLVRESSITTPLAHASSLVAAALEDVDDVNVPVSSLLRKAIRIARLRNDFGSLVWLAMEMRPIGDEDERDRALKEVAPHFRAAELRTIWEREVEGLIKRHTVTEDKMMGASVPDIEEAIRGMATAQAGLGQLPPGLHSLDVFHENRRHEKDRMTLTVEIQQRRLVLSRVRQRVADFFSQTERELLFGHLNADIFERNRVYVDTQLKRLAPEALEQFAAAYRRRGENDRESRAHAVTSCRRVLKTVADALYPATDEEVTGVDGKTRKMTEDRFVMRLCQFAAEKGQRSKSVELIAAQVKALGDRLDALNDLASKGLHADADAREVDQCLIQTYLTVGDLLRLAEGESGTQLVEAA
jgi:hypothetical protein